MDKVYNNFEKYAIVPFRDASIKNMILVNDVDDFYLERFQGNEKERDNQIEILLKENKLESIINSPNSKIIDIDFSSCVHFTTPYDDIISFRFHQRTAPYFYPFDNIEMWNKELNNGETFNKDMLVATFIMRFLRFGGRKLLYRIVVPELHSKRFKHDTEVFYFKELQKIIAHYEIGYLSESIKLFKKIEEILESENKEDFFIKFDNESISNKINEIRKKETYTDVFPY